MTFDFTPFSTVFQSYQDDGWVIMKDCVQWNLVYGWKISVIDMIKNYHFRIEGRRLGGFEGDEAHFTIEGKR